MIEETRSNELKPDDAGGISRALFGAAPVAGCTCPTLTGSLMAALEDREVGPCEAHDPDAFKAAQVKADRDDAIARAARIEQALDHVRAGPPPEPEPHPLARVVDLFTGKTTNGAALNGDGLLDSARSNLGASHTPLGGDSIAALIANTLNMPPEPPLDAA